MSDTHTSEILTGPELVELFRLPSMETLYKWRALGIGPTPYKVGRHLRYKRSEALAWLDQQKAS